MIESIFKFNDTKSKDIMTSRKDTFSINIDDDIEENIDKLLNSNYSRIPVYKDNIDNIIGIVHVRDILIQAKDRGFENINLEEIMHKPYFVPTSEKTNELFKILQNNKIQMAILIDEYGGFCGIVTMEDLVEEIVGDIFDEYDEFEEEYEKIDDKTYIISGKMPIYDVNKLLNSNIPEGDYDTLSGYLQEELGRIPTDEENPIIETKELTFKIEEYEDKRILKVKACKNNHNQNEEEK